jgi:predicted P-loop ATPase
VARENSYHPVRDFLNSLAWDGQDRLSRWLIDYLGAEDTEYVRAVGRAWLISAVARAMKPGCKADYMLVLEGPQGKGKSTALHVLAGPWFSDSLPRDVGHKDAKDHLRGSWIIEMGELASIKRSEVEELKTFLAACADRFRPAYARYEVEWPRQCVFAGTTNEARYLKDPTGNRRHWPVLCGDIDLEGLRSARNKLLAEAVVAYRQGERWWLDEETEAVARDVQDARREDDPWVTAISDYLEQIADNRVTTRAVGKAALGLSDKDFDPGNRTSQRIARILTVDLGCEKKKIGKINWYYLPEKAGDGSGDVASLDTARRRRMEDLSPEEQDRRRREAEDPM